MSTLNPMIKHLFFSQLKRGCVKQIKKINPNAGDIVSIAFILTSDEKLPSIQKVKLTNFEETIPLDETDKKELCKIVNTDFETLKKTHSHIFILMDFATKTIFIESKLINGEKQKMTL